MDGRGKTQKTKQEKFNEQMRLKVASKRKYQAMDLKIKPSLQVDQVEDFKKTKTVTFSDDHKADNMV